MSAPTQDRLIVRHHDLGYVLLSGRELAKLPDGAAIVMWTDRTGKRVSPTYPAQSLDNGRWVGKTSLGGKIDPDATYQLLHPALVHIWLAEQDHSG